jgi:proteasome lid subunit RPN8/RPN11
MTQLIKLPTFTFSKSVLDEIKSTIGALPAETGGVLGGDPKTGEITHFHFDEDAPRSRVVYTVVADRINPVIQAWNEDDVHLAGFIHSHPRGLVHPSPPDIEFARRLLGRSDNCDLKNFIVPIVQSSADGDFSMRLFMVTRDLGTAVLELPFQVAARGKAGRFPVHSPLYRNTFLRVRDSNDLPRLHKSMAVIIGCGGAAAFIEDLARSGVRVFILIDPDNYSQSNIATQACYLGDVGRPKVTVLRERILSINPLAIVNAIQKPIEAVSDADFRTLMFETGSAGEEVEARILCGLTDSFWAQMRVNLLALHFAVPALAAQVYRGGRAAEIVFTHPATTNQCIRCVLSQRYRAFIEEGFKNDATSEGSQYFATVRLNAAKLFIAMALLHHGSDHGFWGPMLARIGQRNCAQIRCDPDLATTLGLQNFQKAFAGASPDRLFCDETVWLPQHPENRQNGYTYNCPDCLGIGNLLESMGRFEDTRELVRRTRFGLGTPTVP